MSRLLIASILAAGLSTLVGCGASSTRQSIAIPAVNVADSRDESSWTPPESLEGTIVTAQDAREARPRQSKASTSFRPNREERPVRGAIHAATY